MEPEEAQYRESYSICPKYPTGKIREIPDLRLTSGLPRFSPEFRDPQIIISIQFINAVTHANESVNWARIKS